MGVCRMDGSEQPAIKGVEEMVGRFSRELIPQLDRWTRRLVAEPESLEELEREIHASFSRGADMVCIGLIAALMAEPEFERQAERSRDQFDTPLEKGRQRTVRVRLLGGLLVWITSLYCPPKRRGSREDDEARAGVHVELAQFGFGKGVSPGLQSRVARKVALCPSIRLAHQELQRESVDLNVKAVRRIAYQCGESLLQLRRHQLLQWRSGELAPGDELAGKRVSVQIDGGRTKIRGKAKEKAARREPLDADGLPVEDCPGRSKRGSRRGYETDWREPKLVTIFVHDETGKMAKQSKATIDGTLLGPDAIAEITAMHLHRLGAAKAQRISFVADGAPWIWDRIDRIVELASLQEVPRTEILDCCHAVHHVSLALSSLGLSSEERLPLYRQHRTLLRNGQWRRVVEELSELEAPDGPRNAKLATEIAYLRKHGEAGRLSYRRYRQQGLPIGSGAIESTIRRVVNMRLKSNATFWRSENAEAMLQIRAQVVTDRWDDRMVEVSTFRRQHVGTEWHWPPKRMSCKAEDSVSTAT